MAKRLILTSFACAEVALGQTASLLNSKATSDWYTNKDCKFYQNR